MARHGRNLKDALRDLRPHELRVGATSGEEPASPDTALGGTPNLFDALRARAEALPEPQSERALRLIDQLEAVMQGPLQAGPIAE